MRIRLVIAILSKTGKIGTSRVFAFYTAGTDECTEVRNRREILTCHAGCCPGVTRLPPFLQVLRRLPGDRSWYVPLHPVGGKPAEATSPGATRRTSHLRFPVYLDGTARLTRILWHIPPLPKRPLALVP